MVDGPLIIGVTMGDPAGIGPEIGAKLLSASCQDQEIYPVMIGSAEALGVALKLIGIDAHLNVLSEFDPHNLQPGAINVYDPGALNITDVVVGQLDELAGEASRYSKFSNL